MWFVCYVVINKDGHLIPGKNATLRCEVQGITNYKPLLWERNGKQITPDGEKYITDQSNNSLLIITPSKCSVHCVPVLV